MSQTIKLPNLRPDQWGIAFSDHQWNVVRCGRRYGKSYILRYLAGDALLKGQLVGVYAPQFATLTKTYNEIYGDIEPVVTGSNKGHLIESKVTGGGIDFWSLESGLFGRGREYDLLLFDETAFTKDGTLEIYRDAISPVVATRPGFRMFSFSTPLVMDLSNFFYALHEHKDYKWNPKIGADNYERFKVHHRPSWCNPLVDDKWLRGEYRKRSALSWRQEIEGEFVDWSGISLFPNPNKPVDPHPRYDAVFAVIDTAMKSGIEHDGTACMWLGYSDVFGPDNLHILDWEVTSLDASGQYDWLKRILNHGEALARHYKSHQGFTVAYIEDKQSGIVLLQQGKESGLPVEAINSKFTALGKDERMRICVDPVHANRVKFVHESFNKLVEFKNESKNHALKQILSYRIGDKEAYKRADDLADCFAYSVIQTLVPELSNKNN
ncbi:hypothetical protein [Burkholderia cenocepacia]|uniref:hypothetical protein n=1 Tax=Burkholderia cenocepacia TaxID=95486 RepID=UPI0011781061|nr:hypothetical protein [Burkholderia cenocepacia]